MDTDQGRKAEPPTDEAGVQRLRIAMELAVRLGVVALLIYWCFSIFRPFLIPLVWGIILAVTLYPAYLPVERWVGGRRKSAAILLVLGCLAVLLVPTVLLSESLVEGVRFVSTKIEEGQVKIPPAPESLATVPIVGETLHGWWNLAYTDLEALLQRFQPQLAALGMWFVGIAKQAVIAVFVTAFGLVIAAMLLMKREPAIAVAYGIAARLSGEQGAALVGLAGRAIGAVAKGIVGVAAIQSILAAVGLALAGVPGTGLWSLVVLMLAVAQLPPGLVLGPAIGYLVLTGAGTVTIVLLAVWTVFLSTIDTPLRALFLGRGTEIPLPIIFVGTIGGLLLHGFTGLFVGAVVFSIGYCVFVEWSKQHAAPASAPPAPEEGG